MLELEKNMDEQTTNEELTLFVSSADLEQAKNELLLGGFDHYQFSNNVLLHMIQRKREVQASTIIPVVLEYLMKQTRIFSKTHAVKHIHARGNAEKSLSYQTVGELDFDSKGNYYLVIASSETKRIESLYKVYTTGSVSELWMEPA